MLCSAHQSLDQTIFNELLVSFIFVKPLAPPHNGFISLVTLELSDSLSYGFPIQTGLRLINLLENHFLFKCRGLKRALCIGFRLNKCNLFILFLLVCLVELMEGLALPDGEPALFGTFV